MPRKGENIYKRKDGRWEGRYIKGHSKANKIQYGYIYAYSYKEAKEKLMSRVGSSDYRNSPQVLKETLKNIVNEDQRKILPNIKAPTLLIWGGLDRDTTISDAKIIESLIPDCGLVEYPYGTHFSYLENLNNVNIVLNKFLV